LDAFIGYALICLMGVCLGLMGAGGSLLAVPVLVYLFHVEPTLATSYATIVVGATAAAGAIRSVWNRSIGLRAVMWFGLPCILGAYFARLFLLKIVPEVILSASSFVLTKDRLVMLLFSLTMLLAGLSLFSRRYKGDIAEPHRRWTLLPMGMMVGILTGIVGVGGGFLILPSLVLLAGLDVSRAIGTSLTIIAIKSIFSIFGDLTAGVDLQMPLILSLVSIGIPGVVLGRWLSGRVQEVVLKTAFGVLVSLVGGLMTLHQLAGAVHRLP
jgi:uncharacterized membrane protein YfcA